MRPLLSPDFLEQNEEVQDKLDRGDTPGAMPLIIGQFDITGWQAEAFSRLVDRTLIKSQPPTKPAAVWVLQLRTLLKSLKIAMPERPDLSPGVVLQSFIDSLNPACTLALSRVRVDLGRRSVTFPKTADELATMIDSECDAMTETTRADLEFAASQRREVTAHAAAAKTDGAATRQISRSAADKAAATKATTAAAVRGAAAAPRPVPICLWCKNLGRRSKGHIEELCWTKFPDLKAAAVADKTCRQCQTLGHVKEDCPEKVERRNIMAALALNTNRVIFDSGCSHTAVPSNRRGRRLLRNIKNASGTVAGVTGSVPIVGIGELPLTESLVVPAVLVDYGTANEDEEENEDSESAAPGPSLVALVQVLNSSDSLGCVALPAMEGEHTMNVYDFTPTDQLALRAFISSREPVLSAPERDGILVIDGLAGESSLSQPLPELAQRRSLGAVRHHLATSGSLAHTATATTTESVPLSQGQAPLLPLEESFHIPRAGGGAAAPTILDVDGVTLAAVAGTCSTCTPPTSTSESEEEEQHTHGARYLEVATQIALAALMQHSVEEVAAVVFDGEPLATVSAAMSTCSTTAFPMRAKTEPLTEEELAAYRHWHDVTGHPCDAMLLSMSKAGMVPGMPRRLKVPSTPHKCTICELAKGIATKLMRHAPEYVHPTRRGQIIAFDTQFVLSALGLPNCSRYWLAAANVYTGYGWCIPVQNKSQITSEAISLLRRIDRLVKTEGGVIRVLHDMGSEFENTTFHDHLDATGIEESHFAPGEAGSRGVVERPHAEGGNVLRTTKASCDPAVSDENWTWWCKHQEMLRNYRPAHNDSRISKFEAMLGFKPTATPHRFGHAVAVKIMGIKRPLLQMRAVLGRWWGMLSNSQTVHMVCIKVMDKKGQVREVVRRTRHLRFLTEAEASLSQPDIGVPVLEEELGEMEVDTEGRSQYSGPWVDLCSRCDTDGFLWCCDFCRCAYHEACSGSTRTQLESTWRCPACREGDSAEPFFPPDCRNCGEREAEMTPETETGVASPDALLAPETQTLLPSTEVEFKVDVPAPMLNAEPSGRTRADMARDTAVSVLQRLGRDQRAASRYTGLNMRHLVDGAWDRRVRIETFSAAVLASSLRHNEAVARSLQRREIRAQSQPPSPPPYDEGFMTAEEEKRLMGVIQSESQARSRQIKQLQRHHRALHNNLAARHVSRSGEHLEHAVLAGMATAAQNLKAFEPPTAEGMYLDEKQERESAKLLREQRLRARQDEEERAEDGHDTSVPSWIQRLGSNYVPIGGFEESDICWISALAASGIVLPLAEDINTPRGYKQALMSAEWPMWKAAIDAELAQLQRRKAFNFVPRGDANGQCFLGTTWVFTVKNATDETGARYLKYKARLTVRGDQQRPQDIDPTQRSSPTVDSESIRIIIATLAADPSAEFIQFDVVGAYLQATLDTNSAPIFLRVPDGMHGVPQGQILQLKINLYGLVQAAYLWYQEISKTMESQGWTRSYFDGCVWSRTSASGPTYMCLHVDDGIICGRNTKMHYDNLAAVYELKFLGRPVLFLGVQFEFLDNHMIFLHQTAYAQHLLRYWQDHPEHPLDTSGPHSHRDLPLDPGVVNELRNFDNAPTKDEHWYRELLGQLNWLLQTRPDFSIAIMHLARGIGQHTRSHEQAAHDLLKHIATTVDFGILYGRNPQSSSTATTYERATPVTYEDSEFGGDAKSGYADQGVLVFLKGSLISFKSSRQRSRTKSTYEAEILSFSEGAHITMRIINYQKSFGLPPAGPVPVFVDNDSVVQYSNQVGLPRPSRNLVQSAHYGRDQRLAGHLTVHPIASSDNPADFMTKALPFTAHLKHRSTCGIFSRQALLSLLLNANKK